MDNWKDPRKNPRKWGWKQHSRVTTDTLLTILIVVMWCIAVWAMGHLSSILVQKIYN